MAGIIELFRDYYPHKGQAQLRASRARFKNLLAGRRWGKDFAGAREFVRRAILEDYPKVQHIRMPSSRFIKYTKPLLHYWAVAPDFNIGKIQQREIFSIFPIDFQNNKANFDYDDNKKELRLFGGKILVEFKSADRPETLVGVGLNGVYATEFARFKESAWNGNIRPTLTDKSGWGIFTSTPLPKQWYLDFYALGDPNHKNYTPDHENFTGKTLDNIRIKDIVREVELARKTMPAKYFRREYEASLECFEGQVYDEWAHKTHCPTPFVKPRFDVVIAGVDWGFAEAGVILVVGVKWIDGVPHFYVIDESYEQGVLIESDDDCWRRRAQILQLKYSISVFYCDSAEPNHILHFRNHGLNAISANKDVTDGIQSVATAMHVSEVSGKPRLVIDGDACKNLVRELPQYQYDKDEEPLQVDDHAPDALRYAIHSYLKYGATSAYLRSDLTTPRE